MTQNVELIEMMKKVGFMFNGKELTTEQAENMVNLLEAQLKGNEKNSNK